VNKGKKKGRGVEAPALLGYMNLARQAFSDQLEDGAGCHPHLATNLGATCYQSQ
jgi:hypothetical protein